MSVEQITRLFDGLFAKAYRTTLIAGADEPYYEVKPDGSAHIHFREDFISSALHEVAHWCLAGRKRRQTEDYGYWYQGTRDEAAQRRFESVEIKPQALEWVFSVAVRQPFRVSVDNLDLPHHNADSFKESVRIQAELYRTHGIGRRATQFTCALYELVRCDEVDSAEMPLSDILSNEQFLKLPQ